MIQAAIVARRPGPLSSAGPFPKHVPYRSSAKCIATSVCRSWSAQANLVLEVWILKPQRNQHKLPDLGPSKLSGESARPQRLLVDARPIHSPPGSSTSFWFFHSYSQLTTAAHPGTFTSLPGATSQHSSFAKKCELCSSPANTPPSLKHGSRSMSAESALHPASNDVASDDWNVYRTRFLVQAKQLTEPLTFIDPLGREHCGMPGDYLVQSSEGLCRIAPKAIFEDVYVPLTPPAGDPRFSAPSQLQPRLANLPA